MIFGYFFSKIRWENASLIKNEQEDRVLYMKTEMNFYYILLTCLRMKYVFDKIYRVN
jgi:hypothetical protein